MNPILLSVLMGLTAAAANVLGGAIIVQKHWDRSYLKYFVALGAGFMLATAIIEIFPASLELRGKSAAFLVLVGYLIIHFFEHTVTPHFHFGEETHEDEFVQGHKGYSVLIGLIIHTFFDGIAIASGFIVSNWLGWIIFLAVFLHKIAGERPKPAQRLGRIHAPGRGHPGGSTDHGVAAPPGEFRVTPIGWGDYLRCSLRPCAGGKPRTGSQDGSAGLLRSRSVFLTRLFRSHTLGKI